MGETLLLCGPTGTGKTARVAAEYLRHAAAHGDDAVALILPTARAAQRLSAQIARSRGGLFDPRVFTFPTLAEVLLDANCRPVRRISELQQRLLLSGVAKRLAAEGRLPYLAEVAQLSGFVAAVGGVIDELKRAAVDPQEFAQIARERLPRHPANEDVAAIYDAYQSRLAERGLYDEPGAFWEARDLLQSGQARPLESVSLLLVDGFSEFTTTQLEVLGLLCGRVERAVITLCLGGEGARRELFAVTERTRGQLRERLGEVREEWLGAEEGQSSLDGVRAQLFGGAEMLADDGSVRVLGAPGVRGEVREIARRIKELVLGGVPPNEITLVLRSLDGYDVAIREVFREYGIPLEITRGEALGRCPAVQAVLDILDVIANDYRRDDVVKLLNNSYVDLEALASAAEAGGLTADDFEAIALKARVIRGKETWGARFNVLARQLQAEHGRAREGALEDEDEEAPRRLREIEGDTERLERCVRLMTALSGLLDPIARAKTMPRAVRRLGEAIERLGIVARASRGAVENAAAARDLSGLALLFGGLRELGEAPQELALSEELGAGEFISHVRELCLGSRLPARRAAGSVCALDVYEARQVRTRHVFVAGLSEGAFPRDRRQDPFYHDDARRRLSGGGRDRRGPSHTPRHPTAMF